jgi:hypothetical protein
MIILCTALCYQIALLRRADARFWAVMGLLFGPFAVPFVFFSKAKTLKKNNI